MNVWTTTSFKGRWSVPVAAVVVAATAREAAKLMNAELEALGLPQESLRKPEHFKLVNTNAPAVIVLNDGDY